MSKTNKIKNDVDKAMLAFLGGHVGRFGKYYALPNALVYRTLITSNYGNHQQVGQDIIARKLGDGTMFGNSSVLKLIGRTVSFGNERLNRGETEIQNKLATKIPMIPFTVFEQANLNLANTKILDRGNEQNVTVSVEFYDRNTMEHKKRDEIRHYTGASLYQIDGKYFLFDIDQEEIKHKIFNPFLVELPRACETIADAYELLKPELVKNAEKNKVKVERQGEWFFIETNESPSDDIKLIGSDSEITNENRYSDWHYSRETVKLQAGNNRPNYVQQGFNKNGNWYVRGRVSHSGREHRDLELGTEKYFLAIPNTATNSFTIEGDID